MEIFDNPGSQAAGIGDTLDGGLIPVLQTINAAFVSYDLTTAIGPLSGSSSINSGEAFRTTAGDFILFSIGDSTFTATTNAAAAPEPSTLCLAGLGALGLFGSLVAAGRRVKRPSRECRPCSTNACRPNDNTNILYAASIGSCW